LFKRITLILILTILTLFLVGCIDQDLPPEPGAPGVGIVGEAHEAVPAGYAPHTDVFDNDRSIFSVFDNKFTGSSSVLLVADSPGAFIFSQGYIYLNGSWQLFNYLPSGTSIGGEVTDKSVWLVQSEPRVVDINGVPRTIELTGVDLDQNTCGISVDSSATVWLKIGELAAVINGVNIVTLNLNVGVCQITILGPTNPIDIRWVQEDIATFLDFGTAQIAVTVEDVNALGDACVVTIGGETIQARKGVPTLIGGYVILIADYKEVYSQLQDTDICRIQSFNTTDSPLSHQINVTYVTAGDSFAEDFVFQGSGTVSGTWIKDSAYYLTNSLQSGIDNFAVAYICKKYDDVWRCGCTSQSGPCNQWSINNAQLICIETERRCSTGTAYEQCTNAEWVETACSSVEVCSAGSCVFNTTAAPPPPPPIS